MTSKDYMNKNSKIGKKEREQIKEKEKQNLIKK